MTKIWRFTLSENRLFWKELSIFLNCHGFTSLDGSPTVSRTMTIVTRPAWGIPAAPMEAAVAVMLMAAMLPTLRSRPRTWSLMVLLIKRSSYTKLTFWHYSMTWPNYFLFLFDVVEVHYILLNHSLLDTNGVSTLLVRQTVI